MKQASDFISNEPFKKSLFLWFGYVDERLSGINQLEEFLLPNQLHALFDLTYH